MRTISIKVVVAIVGVVGLLAFCDSYVCAKAYEIDELRNSLKATDNVLAQGVLTYERKPERKAGAQPINQVVASKMHNYEKQGVSQAEIERMKPKFRTEAALEQKAFVTSSRETLTYCKDRRFLRQTVFKSQKIESLSTQMYDGQNEILTIGKQVDIQPGQPADINSAYLMVGFYPGASFMLGRGLSLLQDVKVREPQNGKYVVVEGKALDGTIVRATLDTGHDYVAKKIERRTDTGRLISRTVLGSPISFKGTPLIASSAIYEVYKANGQIIVKNSYRLISANFGKPSDSLFHLAFDKDMTIVDNRLGKPIVYQYKKATSRVKSKEELLILTRKNLEKEANILAQQQRTEREEGTGRNLLVLLPMLLLGALAVAYRFRHRVNRV